MPCLSADCPSPGVSKKRRLRKPNPGCAIKFLENPREPLSSWLPVIPWDFIGLSTSPSLLLNRLSPLLAFSSFKFVLILCELLSLIHFFTGLCLINLFSQVLTHGLENPWTIPIRKKLTFRNDISWIAPITNGFHSQITVLGSINEGLLLPPSRPSDAPSLFPSSILIRMYIQLSNRLPFATQFYIEMRDFINAAAIVGPLWRPYYSI